jgi:hypothetical protein
MANQWRLAIESFLANVARERSLLGMGSDSRQHDRNDRE